LMRWWGGEIMRWWDDEMNCWTQQEILASIYTWEDNGTRSEDISRLVKLLRSVYILRRRIWEDPAMQNAGYCCSWYLFKFLIWPRLRRKDGDYDQYALGRQAMNIVYWLRRMVQLDAAHNQLT
jgi:hypothetical protein